MADTNLNVRIKNAYKTESEWSVTTTIPKNGELLFTKGGLHDGEYKIGDGTHRWSDLTYVKPSYTYPELEPLMTKTYNNVICTANSDPAGYLYFMTVKPDDYNTAWTIRYRVHATIAGVTGGYQDSEVLIEGTRNTYLAYSTYNAVNNTSYRPYYYHMYFAANETGQANNYPHLLGFRFQSSYNPATAANSRTIVIEILEYDNCTITFLDTMKLFADMPGSNSTNYGNTSSGANATRYSFDGVTQGWSFSGDRNTYPYLLSAYYTRPYAGVNGTKQYSLAMEDSVGRLQSFTTTHGTGTSKAKNTQGFRLGRMYYLYTSGNYTEGQQFGNDVARTFYYAVDLQYSTNCGTTLTAFKPVYIVGTYNPSDALFYLDDTWWTQTLPTSANGKIYIYIGHTYDTRNITFEGYHDPVWYKDGAIRQFTPDTTYTAGTGLTLSSNNQFSISSANASTILNLLSTGSSTPTDNDYYISQYVGGGTTTTTYHRRPMSALWAYIQPKIDNQYVQIRNNSAQYLLNIGAYAGGTGEKKYARIKLPDSMKNIWAMIYLEIAIRGSHSQGQGGKILINAYHSAASPYTWQGFTATTVGYLPQVLAVYASDGQYFYIEHNISYRNFVVERMMVGDTAYANNLSAVTVDFVDELPDVYETASMYYGLHTGNTTITRTLTSGTKIGTITINGTATDLYCQTNTNILTGVKGDAESSYRTGNVNLTPANIGALALSGGLMTGPIKWSNNTALPQATSANYLLTIDAFADGGTQKWINASNVTVGSATNATNATTATKATQDESGNNIKASYAASFSISDHTITLKNKNGVSLGTVTVPDNNTTYSAGTGISLSGTTFSNSGVRSVATGSTNGTIAVNTNGTTSDVAVKGLAALAYKASLSKSDVGLGNVDNTSDLNKPISSATQSALASKLSLTGGTVTGPTDFEDSVSIDDLNVGTMVVTGAASFVNGINANQLTGSIPSALLPSYVDDVLEYNSSANFPSTGETGKIYVATNTNLTYRWSGSQYVEISPSLALGTTSSTAYRGDYGNTAYAHATDSSRLTTAKSSGFYKIATTAQGHVASVTAVTKGDLTALGVITGGSNAKSAVTISPTTTSVYSMTTDGAVTAGTANVPTKIDTTKFNAGSFTRGTFSQGTLPTLNFAIDANDSGNLKITFSQGTLPTHAADSYTAPSLGSGFYTAGTANTPTAVTLPQRTQVSGLWNGYNTGVNNTYAAAQTFTGSTT